LIIINKVTTTKMPCIGLHIRAISLTKHIKMWKYLGKW